MPETKVRPITRCRSCGAEVDARLVQCPECGGCCPGCTTSGLKVRISESTAERRQTIAKASPCAKLLAMHEEIGHALMEAHWELDNLPLDPESALVRLYAVLDDLHEAIERTQALDTDRVD